MDKDKEKSQRQLGGLLGEMAKHPKIVDSFSEVERRILDAVDYTYDASIDIFKKYLSAELISLPEASSRYRAIENHVSETFDMPLVIARLLRMEEDIDGSTAGYLQANPDFVEDFLGGEWPIWIVKPSDE